MKFIVCVILLATGALASLPDKHLSLTPAQQRLADELLQSDVIQTYSDVFVQLGERLVELTSQKQTDNTVNDVIAHLAREESGEISGKAAEKTNNFVEQRDVILPGSSAWSTLKQFDYNIEKQKVTRPPGYLTRNGSEPVALSSQAVTSLQKILEGFEAKHKPKNRNQWEKLNIYKKIAK